MNRLAGATSPYLLQHADNPVDWWPWGAGGVRRGATARRAGAAVASATAACHWCHVMARESFEDEATAELTERALRVRQGGPRGAAGRRRRLHGGGAGRDRTGRLADDGLPHPRRRALLLRHLLPARTAARHARLPAGAPGRAGGVADRRAEVAEAAGGIVRELAGRRIAPQGAAEPPARGRSRRGAVRARPARPTRRTAGSAVRRSSRRRWCWSSCCGTTRAPARTAPWSRP